MTIIVDTGVLLAAADDDDSDHDRCAELLRRHRDQLVVPVPVIAEPAWQIERNLGPPAAGVPRPRERRPSEAEHRSV